VGDPMDKKTDVGPLVSEKQLRKLQNQVTKGVVQSGRIIVGGRRVREGEYMDGFYHELTVMIHVNSKMDIMQSETFGPVLPVMVVDNYNRAIKIANSTKFGLTAAVFTKSPVKAKQAVKDLEAGSIYVNEAYKIPCESPWSGIKESGVGSGSGKHGLWEYVHKKHLLVDLTKDKTRPHYFT